jgi:hypothetical protein
MQLFEDFGNRPIVFIRFNPDSYKIGKVRIASCFSIHKTHGIQIVKDTKQWNERLYTLKHCINKWINIDGIPDKEVTNEFLYYNKDK